MRETRVRNVDTSIVTDLFSANYTGVYDLFIPEIIVWIICRNWYIQIHTIVLMLLQDCKTEQIKNDN